MMPCSAAAAPTSPHVTRTCSTPWKPRLCTSCRDAEGAHAVEAAETAETALATRALTELVADERGYALHRRTLHESGCTVDHLFIGAAGLFVIDVVLAAHADVAVKRTRARFTSDALVLTVAGSPATDLVDAVHAQCAEVATGLAEFGQDDVPVIPVLCFVGAELPRRARNRRFGDVRLVAAPHLAEEVGVEGPFDADRRFAIAMSLVALIPSAA